MAKALNSIENFRSEVFTNNIARTERFEVLLNFPGVADGKADRMLTLMCEECNIPSLVASIKPHRINNWVFYRPTNLDFGGEASAVFTFIEKQDWAVRSRIEEWMAYAVNPLSKEVKFANDIEGNATVNTLDQQDNVTASWALYGMVPKVLNMVPLSNNAPGVVRTTVTFTFNRWESKKVESFLS